LGKMSQGYLDRTRWN